MERWLAFYESQNADSIAQLFTEAGIYAANTGEVLRGREGIVTGVRAWFAAAPGARLEVRREQLRFGADDFTAHDFSRFTIRAIGPDCIVDAGHALSVWRMAAGSWLIETLLVNQERSSPDGACPR